MFSCSGSTRGNPHGAGRNIPGATSFPALLRHNLLNTVISTAGLGEGGGDTLLLDGSSAHISWSTYKPHFSSRHSGTPIQNFGTRDHN